jgi:hypothetical protein
MGWLRGQPRDDKQPAALAAQVPLAQRIRFCCSHVGREEHSEASDWQVPSELQRLGLATVQPLSRGQVPLSATHRPFEQRTGVLCGQPEGASANVEQLATARSTQAPELVQRNKFPGQPVESLGHRSARAAHLKPVEASDTQGAGTVGTHRPEPKPEAVQRAKPVGQVSMTGQVLGSVRQEPSRQRVVPVGQGRTVGHWMLAWTHEPSAHNMGRSDGHTRAGSASERGQADELTAQKPSEQRYGFEAGHALAELAPDVQGLVAPSNG